MSERTHSYEAKVAKYTNSWYSRHDVSYSAPHMQNDLDFARTLDAAHATGDPVRTLEAQLEMMPPKAQKEIYSMLPFEAEEFIA